MPSLFLGKIGNKEKSYEIHALTKDLPFREFKASEIADSTLFHEMLKGRYKILESGHAIFCTAIHPDVSQKTEMNPHDVREGTVHIIAINKHGDIASALSIAVDTGIKDKGTIIGLPLENRWQKNGYPEGAALDKFRKYYFRLNYQQDRDVQPWEMAELYRHFKSPYEKNNFACRLGVYTGCYHLMVREARKKGQTQTTLWVFDAIPAYFNLYRYAGIAVLRNLTVEQPVQYLSPNKKEISRKQNSALFYKGRKISREVKIPFPRKNKNGLSFKYKNIPFLDGVVDSSKCEKAIRDSAIFLRLKNVQGLNLMDRFQLRAGLGVIGKRIWDEDYHPKNIISKVLNNYILKRLDSSKWEFNRVGSCK